jgi:galactose mutarotase-like enzyme
MFSPSALRRRRAVFLAATRRRLRAQCHAGDQSHHDPFIAIAPVSPVDHALDLAGGGSDAAQLGLVTLRPGESCSARMAIEGERIQ